LARLNMLANVTTPNGDDPYVQHWEGVHRKATIFATALYVGVPPLVGVVVSQVSDFGRHASLQYFSIVAEGLLPVLLVAAVVQWSLLARRQLDLDPSDLMEKQIAHMAAAFFGIFVVGEGVALYAVAAEASSTFMVVVPLAAGLALLSDLVLATRRQLGKPKSFDKYLPSKSVAKYAERERKMRITQAEKLEERAEKIRARARRNPPED